jgi:hypothetical protein
LGIPGALRDWVFAVPPRRVDSNAAVFAVAFYRVVLPRLVLALLVVFPALSGMRQARMWLGKESRA